LFREKKLLIKGIAFSARRQTTALGSTIMPILISAQREKKP